MERDKYIKQHMGNVAGVGFEADELRNTYATSYIIFDKHNSYKLYYKQVIAILVEIIIRRITNRTMQRVVCKHIHNVGR